MKNEKEKFGEDWFGPQFMSKMQIGLVAVCHRRSKSRGHSKAKCQIHIAQGSSLHTAEATAEVTTSVPSFTVQ